MATDERTPLLLDYDDHIITYGRRVPTKPASGSFIVTPYFLEVLEKIKTSEQRLIVFAGGREGGKSFLARFLAHEFVAQNKTVIFQRNGQGTCVIDDGTARVYSATKLFERKLLSVSKEASDKTVRIIDGVPDMNVQKLSMSDKWFKGAPFPPSLTVIFLDTCYEADEIEEFKVDTDIIQIEPYKSG